ncbi:hypothetical protein BpHYR1_020825 [Brachionus plicatilis]|uniref:Uncharacterized protein n=1 Tax=Brachionus plicatilis TaxID=10195 RepID=A0A3M7PJX9_BRAPC|nr:hypothetical protein BpHYR1_020825 [Brachionus plicatilis]
MFLINIFLFHCTAILSIDCIETLEIITPHLLTCFHIQVCFLFLIGFVQIVSGTGLEFISKFKWL